MEQIDYESPIGYPFLVFLEADVPFLVCLTHPPTGEGGYPPQVRILTRFLERFLPPKTLFCAARLRRAAKTPIFEIFGGRRFAPTTPNTFWAASRPIPCFWPLRGHSYLFGPLRGPFLVFGRCAAHSLLFGPLRGPFLVSGRCAANSLLLGRFAAHSLFLAASRPIPCLADPPPHLGGEGQDVRFSLQQGMDTLWR